MLCMAIAKWKRHDVEKKMKTMGINVYLYVSED
jgi:hypothetical protein